MKVEVCLFKNWIVYFNTPTTNFRSSVSMDFCIILNEYRRKNLDDFVPFKRLEREGTIENKDQLIKTLKLLGKHHNSIKENNIIKADYIILERN
jgi:hypothetical protein